MVSKGERKYSFEEYIELEETSEVKHDFYYGEVYAMAGGTANHNKILLNTGASLNANKKTGCDVFIDGMRLEIDKNEFYVYPDIMYTCNDDLKGDDVFVKNPSIIIEVLSESTALYDRDIKLKYYKKIKSLNYYVLISQKAVMVEIYSRTNNQQIWQYQTFENLTESIAFERLGIDLPLSAIYDSVNVNETN